MCVYFVFMSGNDHTLKTGIHPPILQFDGEEMCGRSEDLAGEIL